MKCPVENKCPLCGKVNPDSEWACEDCGAKLPNAGQRAKASGARQLGTVPAKHGKNAYAPANEYNPSLSWKGVVATVGALFLAFLALVAINPGGHKQPVYVAPTPWPTSTPEPTPIPVGRLTRQQISTVQAAERRLVWVNSNSGKFHGAGSRWYGETASGYYTTAQEALESGYHAATNE